MNKLARKATKWLIRKCEQDVAQGLSFHRDELDLTALLEEIYALGVREQKEHDEQNRMDFGVK